MNPISVQQIRQIVGGRPLSQTPGETTEIASVCTDTRRLEPGALFVAVKGENHNGHEYLSQAAAAGAVAALVEEEPALKQPNVHLIGVTSTRAALGKLARYVRQQMTAKVIAVAGSNGKTGTKNLIDAALCHKLRGSISPKSFNNDIGVPLAIFPADPNQDYLVLEIGTNRHGEIGVLTRVAEPDIAVITNCSAEHLEGLDDLIGVRREEASIIEGLNPKGLLVVNGDDPALLDAVAEYPGKRVTFGFEPSNDLYATDVECDYDGVRFKLNGRRDVRVPLLGRHTACNALAAIAVARRMGLPEDVIIASLARSHGPDMRLQLQNIRGITLINDAYNANPASVQAGLETLCSLPTAGRRVAILGDMLELGAATDRLHLDIGRLAATCPIDLLVCVGEKASLIADEAAQAGYSRDRIVKYPNTPSAARGIPADLFARDLVLLKASRSMRFETIAEALGAADGLLKAAS
jgi:UDP-N-acetylmuramoyl-tripeptide--D-alanyl-D-alanine ligase